MTAPGYVGRLAPSPTGDLHLGHLRSFLVAWLRAKQHAGEIRLRIEDLDPPRSVAGASARIVEDLQWLGLCWDGETVLQSERDPDYQAALARLERDNRTFLCSCTRKDIASIASAPHNAHELGFRYPGTCKDGPQAPGPHAVRFRAQDKDYGFRDKLAGDVDGAGWLDDFVLRRKDGLWAYQLAVVVDDAASGITEVVRGDDLLSSTPRQLALYDALGEQPPAFIHLPLVLNKEQQRLSSRHGAVTLRALRDQGATAQSLINLCARSLGVERPQSTLASLIDEFALDKVPSKPVAL